MSAASDTMRREWAIGDAKRDEGLTTPEDVQRFDDIRYGDDPRWNVLDVYRPKEESGKLPVIVSVHGGGWVYGSKEVYQFYCMSLAQRGFTVVNFTYHLAPEDPYPAAFTDINTLFCWVADHAGEYFIDRDNLFTVGDSAGGQLNSQYMTFLTNPEYQKLFPFAPPKGLTVRAAALNCGVYDMKGFVTKDGGDGMDASYFGGKGKPEYLEQLDVMKYITPAFPPSYVMTSYHDFLRQMALPMVQKLQDTGVEVKFHFFGSEDRPQVAHVFHCNIRLPEATVCNDEECDFFRRHVVK